jgi:hypothetical protein
MTEIPKLILRAHIDAEEEEVEYEESHSDQIYGKPSFHLDNPIIS